MVGEDIDTVGRFEVSVEISGREVMASTGGDVIVPKGWIVKGDFIVRWVHKKQKH